MGALGCSRHRDEAFKVQGRPGAGSVSVGQQAKPGSPAQSLSGCQGTCLSPQDQRQEWCFLPPYSFCFSHYTVAETVLQAGLGPRPRVVHAGSANSRGHTAVPFVSNPARAAWQVQPSDRLGSPVSVPLCVLGLSQGLA